MGSGLVTARESGRVIITGGTISHEVAARGNGVVTVASSDIQALGAADEGTATMTGGQVRGNIVGSDRSTITMTSGSVGGEINARNHATIRLAGGHVLGAGEFPIGLYASDFATVEVDGTVIENGATAGQSASLILRSGRIVGDLHVANRASAFLGTGFEITDILWASDESVVQIAGCRVAGHIIANGDSTRVSILDGNVGGRVDLSNTGHLTISGGNIEGGLRVSSGRAFIIGGTVNNGVFADGFEGLVSIEGGEISGGGVGLGAIVGTAFRSRMFITGGTIDTSVQARELSTITIAGGVIENDILSRNNVHAFGNSNVIVTGGDLRDNLEAHESGHVLLSGGTVGENLIGDGESIVTMNGGLVQFFAIFRENSRFIRTGGTIGQGIIDQTGSSLGTEGLAATASGGDVVLAGAEGPTSVILMHDNATLDIVGRDLAAVLVDPNYQDLFSLYQLSGTLADGTAVNDEFFAIQNGTGASYQLLPVPEPATITLLLPVAILVRRRTTAMRRP